MSSRIETPFTNEHFAAFAEKMAGQPYWYGTTGNRASQSLLKRKTAQYPAHYTASRTEKYTKDIENGRIVCDCGKKHELYGASKLEEAKKIMDSQSGYVILDVREQDEFDESHIPGAILIPHGQIKELAPSMLPDKDQLILVYCRSGRRSKIAAEALEEMGYTNIKEFGGINDWPYETVGE